jgi:hypothetical protein
MAVAAASLRSSQCCALRPRSHARSSAACMRSLSRRALATTALPPTSGWAPANRPPICSERLSAPSAPARALCAYPPKRSTRPAARARSSSLASATRGASSISRRTLKPAATSTASALSMSATLRSRPRLRGTYSSPATTPLCPRSQCWPAAVSASSAPSPSEVPNRTVPSGVLWWSVRPSPFQSSGSSRDVSSVGSGCARSSSAACSVQKPSARPLGGEAKSPGSDHVARAMHFSAPVVLPSSGRLAISARRRFTSVGQWVPLRPVPSSSIGRARGSCSHSSRSSFAGVPRGAGGVELAALTSSRR